MNKKTHTNFTVFYHLVAIILATILIYSKVPQFDFLKGWDDQWFVLNDYTEDGFSIKNIQAIASDFYYGQYAPLNQLYYTSIYFFIKYEPAYYHILNVVIHLSNTILIYFLSRRLAFKLIGNDKVKNTQVAFFSAFLFAILPVNLEPVAWVAASKVGLYSLFYLFAIHAYLHYLKSNTGSYYYISLLCFILSFGAKEQAVILPFCLILIDYVYRRPFNTSLIWYEKAPFLILSLLFGLITLQSQTLEADRNAEFYPLYERIVLSTYTLWQYITKIIFPLNLSYLYPFPYAVGEEMPKWLWSYAIATPMILILTCRYFSRWMIFGLLFFFIHIALVLNLVSLARFSIIADRYTYLSTFGLCFIAGCLIVRTLDYGKYRSLFSAAVAIYFCALGVQTFQHSFVWKNVETLKDRLRTEIRQRPDYKALKDKIKNHE